MKAIKSPRHGESKARRALSPQRLIMGTLASSAILLAGCGGSSELPDQITISSPEANAEVTRNFNENFAFTLDATDVRLSTVTLNGVNVRNRFIRQEDGSYAANFASIRGFLDDGKTNTLRVTATNSRPETVTFRAEVASPGVIITNVSTRTGLPEADSLVGIIGVTRKTDLDTVFVGGVPLEKTANQFSGQTSVPDNLTAPATEPDYTFTANFSGGTSSTTEFIAHGRPIASALAMQINNGAYGPVTEWLEELFIERLREDDSDRDSDRPSLIPPITDPQSCGFLLNSASAGECNVTFDIATDTVEPTIELMSVTPASDAYGVDVQLKLSFDFVAANVTIGHAGRTVTTVMTWDVDSTNEGDAPIEVDLTLRARKDAASGTDNGYVVGVYLQDIEGSDSDTLDFDLGSPTVSGTNCFTVSGTCQDQSGDQLSGDSGNAIIRAGWIAARPTVSNVAVAQFREAVADADDRDSWDGSEPVLLRGFSIPANTTEPRPVSEGSSIREVATVLPGDVSFANNGNAANNGAFLAVGTGTRISNAADNVSNLNAILGSRFNATPSEFLTANDRLGDSGGLMVALSENSLNQELSLRYAAKQFDNLAAVPGGAPNEDGITKQLNDAINALAPIPVGEVVKNSQIDIAVSTAPYIQLETGNQVRLVMPDVQLELKIDLGDGSDLVRLVDSDLDLEAVLGFSVDAEGQPDFDIDSNDILIDVLNVSANESLVVAGVPIRDNLARQVESEVRKALLETLPTEIDKQLQELGDLILPRQAPFLANVGTDAPAALINTLPKVFGLRLAQNGISVEGSHLLLKGELRDVTTGTNDTLVSMCIYSSEEDLDTCPPASNP